jgi:rsbT antagonist protein RsbS
MDRIPILKLGGVLLVTLQGDLEDSTVTALEDDLTARIVKTGARGALIDVSSLDVVDTFVGRALANIAAMARVLDAEVVVVGIRPAVAITLVELGVRFSGVRTALDVDTGMALLRTSIDAAKSDVPTAD